MGKDPKDHICYKNWTDSSTAMESDIILEGFRASVDMHGLKYARLIGDGDSSVYNKLLNAMPYGPNLLIEKVECKNHIIRNYSNRLKEIAQNSKLGNVSMRNAVRQRILRLRYAVTKAVDFRSSQKDLPETTRTEELERDIINGPSHVFGEHKKCKERGYFCEGSKPEEENLVPDLTSAGIYQEVMSAVHRVAFHSSSLIINVNTNCAEAYNACVAKFIGGKRINFACRGSYKTRCEAAVTSYNTKGELHRYVHKAMVEESPGSYTKKFVRKRKEGISNRKRKLDFTSAENQKKRRVSSLEAGPDKDYGPEAQKPDMTPEEYIRHKERFLKELKLSEKERQELQSKTIGQSRSQLWRQERLKRITASSFGRICKMKESTSCQKIVMSLLYSSNKRTPAMMYGIEKEPFALQQFENEYGVTVDRCGLFIDSEQSFLGASPDGVIGDEFVVEVKCPAAASSMTPAEAIAKGRVKFCTITSDGQMRLKQNDNYMYQVQGQLHITRRSFCYFLFWTPHGMLVQKISRDDKFWEGKMELQLKRFYMECLLPELVDPRHTRKMIIRDPQYIINSQSRGIHSKRSKTKTNNINK